MDPGTERALQSMATSILPLKRAIESLTEAVKELAHLNPEEPNPKGVYAAALVLGTAQWTELLEAVEYRASQIRSGSCGDGSGLQDREWADELDELHKIICQALKEQGIKL